MSNVIAALKHAASQLDEAYEKIAHDMAMGHIKSFDDYKYSAGVARGYMVAKDTLLGIAEHINKGDSDE